MESSLNFSVAALVNRLQTAAAVVRDCGLVVVLVCVAKDNPGLPPPERIPVHGNGAKEYVRVLRALREITLTPVTVPRGCFLVRGDGKVEISASGSQILAGAVDPHVLHLAGAFWYWQAHEFV